MIVLASQLLFYFLFKQSKSDLVLRPCSSVALSYGHFLWFFIPNCLLLLLSVKQIHKQEFGKSGCLSGTSLGMKGLSPVAIVTGQFF